MLEVSAILITLTLASQGEEPSPTIGQCDPVDAPAVVWTDGQRQETRRRAQRACERLGASYEACVFADVVGKRESDFRPGVRHTRGRRENGIGAHGINKRWHYDKWPDDLEPAMCTPEASLIVVLDIVDRAQQRWGAKNLREVQSVYAGRTRSYVQDGKRIRTIVRDLKKDRGICDRLARRGVDCEAPLPPRAAGRRIPVQQRPAVAEQMVQDWHQRKSQS